MWLTSGFPEPSPAACEHDGGDDTAASSARQRAQSEPNSSNIHSLGPSRRPPDPDATRLTALYDDLEAQALLRATGFLAAASSAASPNACRGPFCSPRTS